jgi:polygalacturonase
MRICALYFLWKCLSLAILPVVPEAMANQGNETPQFNVDKPRFPDREFIITDFGAVKDGVTLSTESINRTIRECNAAGGGKVIIPQGIWITGPVRLLSNVNLHMDEGAMVVFSSDFNDYPYVYTSFEGKNAFRAMPLIFGDSAENIAITGNGIIDGSGDAWRPVRKTKMTSLQWSELIKSGGVVNESGDTWWPDEYAYQASSDPAGYSERLAKGEDMAKYKAYFRPPLVQFVNCSKVLLEGPLFQNSPGWGIHLLLCSLVTVHDISVRNPWYAQNGDGIDIESCRYVLVDHSRFDTGDDAICLKSGKDKEGRERGKPTQYVEVSYCMVHHGHGGFVVGSEMSGGVRDIWVHDCRFMGTDAGLRFKSMRGRGGVVEDIRIENIQMLNIKRDAIVINLFYNGLGPAESDGNTLNATPVIHEINEGTPVFKNISITDISCQGADRAMQVMGLPEMPVSGLTLGNSVFNTGKGIECSFANELTMRDVVVITQNAPSFNLINVEGVDISECRGNNEVFLNIDGPESKDIIIRTDNAEFAALKTKLNSGTDPDVVSFRKNE